LSDELYEMAGRDPRTVFIEYEGSRIPAICPIDYGLGVGYDTERCRKIARNIGEENSWFYMLPPDLINESNLKSIVESISVIEGALFFSHSTFDSRTPEDIKKLLDLANRTPEEHLLLDEKAREGNEQTTVTLYGFNVAPKEEISQSRVTNKEVYAKYSENVKEGLYKIPEKDGAFLIMGNMLSQGQIDQMWELYLDRFQFLGENHPLSMEDTKEDFLTYFTDENSLCSIFIEDSKPVCFTFVLDKTESLYWLNGKFLENQCDEDTTLLFFPGIVASGSRIGYSMQTISLIANAFADMHAKARILDENTNLSEDYITEMVEKIINRLGRQNCAPAEKIDKTVYRCIAIK